MLEHKHIIKKQTIEFYVAGRNEAGVLHESMRALYYGKILKIFDEIFSEVCDENEYMFLDLIEIDLGSISTEKTDNESAEKLKAKIYDSLIQQIEKKRARSSIDFITPDGKLIKIPPVKENSKTGAVQSFSETEYNLKLLKHFILTGTLPWWTKQTESDVLQIFSDLIKADNEEFSIFIRSALSSITAQHRICYQFDSVTIEKLLLKMFPEKVGKLFEWEQLIKNNIIDVPEVRGYTSEISKEIKSRRTEVFLKLSHEAEPGINFVGFVFDLFRSFGINQLKRVAIELEDLIQKDDKSSIDVKSELIRSLRKYREICVLPVINKEDARKIYSGADTIANKDDSFDSVISKSLKDQKGLTDITKEGFDTDIVEDEEVEKDIDNLKKKYLGEEDAVGQFYISNSGLVILTPYIERLFSVLNLIRDHKFVDRENQFVAVHVLQWLISGQENSREYELVLNKILCGLNVSIPVPKDLKLNDEIKDECNNLLRSVISNWKTIGSTTIMGLRESFLQREGIINIYRNDIILRVENKSYDILLDNIPWRYSVVKYPWMKKTIYVEWR
ncbi:MAG: hypothetical protein JW995_08495 [Melioribacteraceae bacterium]|nr:hypothetical protein [Melioribacteraceae bacterium]